MTNFQLFHRNFFVIIGELISIANFCKTVAYLDNFEDFLLLKLRACFNSSGSAKKIYFGILGP